MCASSAPRRSCSNTNGRPARLTLASRHHSAWNICTPRPMQKTSTLTRPSTCRTRPPLRLRHAGRSRAPRRIAPRRPAGPQVAVSARAAPIRADRRHFDRDGPHVEASGRATSRLRKVFEEAEEPRRSFHRGAVRDRAPPATRPNSETPSAASARALPMDGGDPPVIVIGSPPRALPLPVRRGPVAACTTTIARRASAASSPTLATSDATLRRGRA